MQPLTLKVPLELQKLLPLESKNCLFCASFISSSSGRLCVQVEGLAEGMGPSRMDGGVMMPSAGKNQ